LQEKQKNLKNIKTSLVHGKSTMKEKVLIAPLLLIVVVLKSTRSVQPISNSEEE